MHAGVGVLPRHRAKYRGSTMSWNHCFIRLTAGALLSLCGVIGLLPEVAGYSPFGGSAWAQVNQRREAPPLKLNERAGQTDARVPKATEFESQTEGRSSSDAAPTQAEAEQGSNSAAEVRRVRAAVVRTLRRAQESFRAD
jgi:hypothetical protein